MTTHLTVLLLSGGMLLAQTAPTRDEITALSRSFLRDSAELPMDVAVATVVKDARGKTIRDAHSTVRFLFRGYNAQAGRFSFRAQAGMMSMRIMNDSIGGNFAVIDAFTLLAPHPDGLADVAVEGGQGAEPFILRTAQTECREFAMSGKHLYPDKRCAKAEFRVRQDAGRALSIERFDFDVLNLPAKGKLPYLGEGNVRRYHAEGELQQVTLPDDKRPFLIPKRVVTTVESEKGVIVVTNNYKLGSPSGK
jgi:hypothetical protein